MAHNSSLWKAPSPHRGQSRRIPVAQEEQSSSEYSSPDIPENDTSLPSGLALPGRMDDGHVATENESFAAESLADGSEAVRQYSGPSDFRPGEEEAYVTSEDSDEVPRGSLHDSRNDADEIMELSRGAIKGRRGKKGLTHAEMAIMGRRTTEVSWRADGTAHDNNHADEHETASNQDADVNIDGEETEGETEDYAEIGGRARFEGTDRQSRSKRSNYPPVVVDAMKRLRARGAEASSLGYARLAGAGKGSVDYIVRKLSITIGRSASLADCAVKSDGKLISRKHANLYWKNERKEWVIRCLSERNGIVVNGIPIVPGSEAMAIRSRDLIEVGDVAFFFLAATSPVVNVNDILTLERTIQCIQNEEDRERERYEQQKQRGSRYGRETQRQRLALKPNKHIPNRMERRKRIQETDRPGSIAGRSGRSYGSKKRTLSMVSGDIDDTELGQQSRKRWRDAHKFRSRSGVTEDADARQSGDERRREDSDPDVTEEDEFDQREGEWHDERPDGPLSTVGINQQLPLRNELMSKENRRSKKLGSSHPSDDSDQEQCAKLKEDWNKKERADFGRALFAVGVDPVIDEGGSVACYDWTRFRKIAELPKKSNIMLEDYYIRMMEDVHSLLEDEEREKRTKGPRTKHKPGCDCIVCENTRKSRRKKREEREHSFADDVPNAESDVGDGVEVKSTAKSSDKLVGLVTAQKLRVRLSIHEAARQVVSGAGRSIFDKLREQEVRDFPGWWRPGYHDRALMRGTAIHGVAQWSDIWNDAGQKAFRKQKERYGDFVVWPSNQAAMKRVREISSAINAELRREAKKAAKGEQVLHVREKRAKLQQCRIKHNTSRIDKPLSSRKKSMGTTEVSGDEYDDVASGAERDGGESTLESGSENAAFETRGEYEALTEEEDVLEVEVEEEMEIEDEEGDETEDEESKTRDVGEPPEKKLAIHAAEISTDEEDEEDNIQYETASDSGSE